MNYKKAGLIVTAAALGAAASFLVGYHFFPWKPSMAEEKPDVVCSQKKEDEPITMLIESNKSKSKDNISLKKAEDYFDRPKRIELEQTLREMEWAVEKKDYEGVAKYVLHAEKVIDNAEGYSNGVKQLVKKVYKLAAYSKLGEAKEILSGVHAHKDYSLEYINKILEDPKTAIENYQEEMLAVVSFVEAMSSLRKHEDSRNIKEELQDNLLFESMIKGEGLLLEEIIMCGNRYARAQKTLDEAERYAKQAGADMSNEVAELRKAADKSMPLQDYRKIMSELRRIKSESQNRDSLRSKAETDPPIPIIKGGMN